MSRTATNKLQSSLFELASDARLIHFLFKMPKVDLHRHLTGSIDAETAVRVGAKYDVPLPTYIARELDEMLFGEQQVRGHGEYFRPWETLNKLFVNKEATRDLILAAAARAAEDNVIYTEMRTGPRGFLGYTDFKFDEFLDATAASTAEAEAEYGIVIRWLLGIPRDVFGPIEAGTRNRMCASMVSKISALYPRCFVGLDLNGDECAASPELFESCFDFAHSQGLPITIHAGETGPAANVGFAVRRLHASRIGHGIASASDPSLLAELASRNCALEICPTSNKLLGLVSDASDLPLGTVQQSGVPFAICSDNPARCRTSLTEELYSIAKSFCLTTKELRDLTYRALDHAFTDEGTKLSLRERLAASWGSSRLTDALATVKP